MGAVPVRPPWIAATLFGFLLMEKLLVEVRRPDGSTRIIEFRDPRERFVAEFNELAPRGVVAYPVSRATVLANSERRDE